MARFNRVALNRGMRHLTPHMPGFGVVHHVGRKSGTEYSTPVNVFKRPGGYTIALDYGPNRSGLLRAAAGSGHTMHGRHVNPARARTRTDSVPRAVAGILSVLDVDTFLLVDEATAT
jgi:hypothetical protein